MKTPAAPGPGRRFLTFLVLLGALFGVDHAMAQGVYLTFTGGGVAHDPLTIAWHSPVVFTATGFGQPSGGAQPFFVFAGVGDVYNFHQYATAVATSPSYTGIDGTGAINNIFSGQNFNDVTPGDVVFTSYSASSSTRIAPGATFDLVTGSLTAGNGVNPTTGVAFFGTVPSDGYYQAFLTDGSFHLIGVGSAVPEPSTDATIAGAAILGFAMWRRRPLRDSRIRRGA